MHEAADLARHVRLVALVLEVAAELHHGVGFGDLLVGERASLGDLGVGHAKLGFEHRLGLLPRGEDAKALEVGRGLDRLGLGGGGAANHGGAGLLLGVVSAPVEVGARPDGGHRGGCRGGHLLDVAEDLRGSIGRASRRSADAWHGGEATDRRARKNSRKKSVQGLTNEGSRGEIGRRARGRLEGGARAAVDGGSIGGEGKDVEGRRSPRVRTAASVKVAREARGAGRHFREAEPRPAKQRLRKPAEILSQSERGICGLLSSRRSKKTEDSHLTVCPFTG